MPPAATTWWSPQTRRCTRRNDWAEIESPWSNGPGPQEDTLPHPELNLTQAFKDLVQIGITLTSEHDLAILLERILSEARRFTRAEAGTLFLREGDHLRFAVVQNDFLERKLGKLEMQRRLQAEPLRLSEPSLAGHAAQTGELMNVADAHAGGAAGAWAFNRRYFTLRIDEEVKRHTRFGHPLSLVVLNIDHVKQLNADQGPALGDEVVREVARLLLKHSRSFTIIARLDGDDFAALLANTPKAGAVTYSEPIRGVIESHPFAHGTVTASFGVAGLPADAASAAD